jgi:hypothetical protein
MSMKMQRKRSDVEIARDAELVVRGTFWQLETAPSPFPYMGRHRSLELPRPSKILADEADDVATVSPRSDGSESALSFSDDESSECDDADDKEDVMPIQRYQTLDFDDHPSPFSVAMPAQHALPVVMPPFLLPHVPSALAALNHLAISGGTDFAPELQLVAQQTARVSALVMEDAKRSARPTGKTGDRKLKTTVIFRNVPLNYTRDMLVTMLDAHGFFGKYDFLYLPLDGSTDANLGFASVSFVTHDDACDAMQFFSGFSAWSMHSFKVCQVEWSNNVQGLSKLIGKYRNSSVMHASVPDHRKPILFRDGMRSEFPRPTANIKQPNFTMWSEARC